ncbi:NlpC/P60 family protein [Lachnospiraceae bacterium KHCPX20]|nr:NlpC/P60 family protein [Lachnospiraceae bacterium KHCPX20]
MKQRIVATLLALTLMINFSPPSLRVIDTKTAHAAMYEIVGKAENPYSHSLNSIFEDKKSIEEERLASDHQFDDAKAMAEWSLGKIKQVQKHLTEQYKKYHDYKKLETVKNTVDQKLLEAQDLYMSASDLNDTGQYKYNIEVAPSKERQLQAQERYAKVRVLSQDAEDLDMTVKVFNGFYDVSKIRQNIVNTATKAKGKISYSWGAKAKANKKGTPKALDCSGFVQWAYQSGTNELYPKLGSTASIGTSYHQIEKNDLQPGDIGMKNPEGTSFVSADGDHFYRLQDAINDNRKRNAMIKKKIKAKKKAALALIKYTQKESETQIEEIEDQIRRIKKAQKQEESTTEHNMFVAKPLPEDIKTLRSEEKRIQKKTLEAEVDIKTDYHKEKKRLKKKQTKEDNISKQIGHVGIFVGKDKKGNYTWVHCTGGSKDTVVVTTEKEYSGFKYFYAPLEQDIMDNETWKKDNEITVPADLDYNGVKTYERFTAITTIGSKQYKLQQMAGTDGDGFRKINNRYLIAVGTGVSADIGRYVDLVLQNGTTIPCIIGDVKADCDTDTTYHIMTKFSHCVSEFIVDGDILKTTVRNRGDVSCAYEDWNSPVSRFILYNKQI